MNTYNHKIINLLTTDADPNRPKTVARVIIELTGTNPGGRTYSTYCMFDLAPGETFTAFDELSEQQVLSWLDGHAMWDFFKSDVDNMLAQPTPVTLPLEQPNLPWAPPPPAPEVASIIPETLSTPVFSTATMFLSEERATAILQKLIEEYNSSRV